MHCIQIRQSHRLQGPDLVRLTLLCPNVPDAKITRDAANMKQQCMPTLDPIDSSAQPTNQLDRATGGLFRVLSEVCDGAVMVDREGCITWIHEKYRALLGIGSGRNVIGLKVEDVIPGSRMRTVLETGRPILLDILDFGNQHFVVTRLPLYDDKGEISGAAGFVLYDRLDRLQPLIARFERMTAELEQTRRELAEARRTRYNFSQFVGISEQSHRVKRIALRAAQNDGNVLLLGETGTGKELLAQSVHGASRRAAHPFIALNIAAIPATLIEAEFFGVAPGAFTGADRKPRKGKFELANHGTLFLDELGDCPLDVQAKLLRVLQEQEIEPLGSNKLVPVDVRIVAATSVDLAAKVDEGKFRADLYFRLNVLPILLPPLRERTRDIEPIANVLLEDIARRSGTQLHRLTVDAGLVLQSYSWPGNVRELRNVLERACLEADGEAIEADHLAEVMPRARAMRSGQATNSGAEGYADAIARFDKSLIEDALKRSGGQIEAAARSLKLSRATLYKKMAKAGIKSRI